MQRKHPGEAMTDAPGALLGEAIRVLIQIVALYLSFPRIISARSDDAIRTRSVW
jgi:hypothetical protein